MLTDDQIAMRRNTIGASEIYEVLTRPARLWRAKVHGEKRFTGKEDFIRLGHLFEPPVARTYERDNGIRMVPSGRPESGQIVPCSFIHPVDRWMSFTPDGIPCSDDSVTAVSSLEGLWALRDAGAVGHLYEGKTNARVAEFNIAPEDQWSEGLDDDADWSDPAESAVRMPLRYMSQLVWSMGLSDLPWMALRRLRFVDEPVRKALAAIDSVTGLSGAVDAVLHALLTSGAAQLHTYRVPADPELFGMLRDIGLRFYRDHILRPDNAPPPTKLEDMDAEVRRIYPYANKPKPVAADRHGEKLIEAWREAKITEKRAEARADFLKVLVQRQIGDAPGLIGGAGKVSLSRSAGRKTVNAEEALGQFCEVLQSDPRVGKLPAEAISLARTVALERATTEGKPGFRMNAPRNWTKGVADQTFIELAEEFGVDVVVTTEPEDE